MTHRIVVWCGLAGLLAQALCVAGEPQGPGEPEDQKATISIGPGVVVTSKPYTGVDSRVYPVPLFSYEGRKVYFRGVAAGYRLVLAENWSINPILRPRFDGYEEEDSSALRGMDDRDMTLDAGAAFSWRAEWGAVGLSLVTDLLGKHDGQELEFSYALPFRVKTWRVSPLAGVRWQSDNLVDYYYGVRRDEVRAGRPGYRADAAVDPFIGLRLQRRISSRWMLMGAIQYEWLDGEIADSPIVDDDYDLSFMAGLLYSF